MKRKPVLVEEAFQEWRKDPEYVIAYNALEDEFAAASARISFEPDDTNPDPR